MAKANNVTRLLDSRRIPYTAHELPAEKLSALEAAAHLGVDPGQVFKTIVATREGRGKPVLAVIPGPLEVDLKALARAIGEKKIHLATLKQAEQLTGLQAGGISPLALLNRGFTVVLDTAAEAFPEIYISGGQRSLNICLPVSALVSLSNAKVAEIST
jgi:Cys-tRNA(Pro)/Cys-tRNA(Cys) deacylase